jgi:curved DNA-binding protein CbpA
VRARLSRLYSIVNGNVKPNDYGLNLYQLLEVSQSATQGEIREAYRLLASLLHPDHHKPGTKQYALANEKLKAINEANEILGNPTKRAEYDQFLAQQQMPRNDASSSVGSRFTAEQERIIEQNRNRYRAALNSPTVQRFCGAFGLESERQKALRDLDRYDLTSAKDLLTRFNTTSRR